MPLASVTLVAVKVPFVSVIVQPGRPMPLLLLILNPDMVNAGAGAGGGIVVGVFVKFWFATSAPSMITVSVAGVTFVQPDCIVSVTVYVPFSRPVN